MDQFVPTYSQGFARSKYESEAPGLWNGLRGMWLPFLGPIGTTGVMPDWSGRGNIGTNTGVAYAKNAHEYDGSSYVTMGAVLDITAQITIATWVNINSTTNQRIIAKANPVQVAPYFQYLLQLDSSGNLKLSGDFGGSGLYYVNYTGGVSAGWQFITATHDGTWSRMYIDGIEVESDNTRTGGFGSHPTWIFMLGKLAYIGTALFDGKMRFAGIWDRALTASEANQLATDPYIMVRPRSSMASVSGLIIPVLEYQYLYR